MESRQTLIEEIKTLLSPREEIALAYLFGSFSKGTPTSHSDIDIAVLINGNISEEGYPYGYRSELLSHLMKGLRTNSIDLVILNEAPPFLRFQVIRYGKIILSRSETARIDFQVKTISRYNDVKRLIGTQQRYISERLKNGTYGKR
ncbi:MAG: nucleotidyltransferase domain-containing protein [Nitrospirae bacterium]|nr:nucleotidyltransferase domain-containing protein [Nitrospirota bacterium]